MKTGPYPCVTKEANYMKEKTWLPGNISDRVRDLREEWGLTRKELAQRSGVDESQLGRIENNKIRKTQDDALTKLAKFFCVSTDFLLGLTDIPDRKNYDTTVVLLPIASDTIHSAGKDADTNHA